MPIRPIVITGEPVLHTKAKPITEFNDELKTLVEDMYQTMDLAPGVGLAGPQVGVPLRLFTYNFDDGKTHWRGVAINPVLYISPTPIGDPDPAAESEGCLSAPTLRYPLRRSEHAILEAVDIENKPFRIEAEGWLARIFQHEYDHLNGILYIDRLNFLEHRRATKACVENGWGKPGLTWTPGVDGYES